MGMFDYVNFSCECPVCGDDVRGFQTKDTECSMVTVEPEDCDHFYSICENCESWIEFTWETICIDGGGDGAIQTRKLRMKRELDTGDAETSSQD